MKESFQLLVFMSIMTMNLFNIVALFEQDYYYYLLSTVFFVDICISVD